MSSKRSESAKSVSRKSTKEGSDKKKSKRDLSKALAVASQAMTHAALQRIMRRGGVKRISNAAYETLRVHIKEYTTMLVRATVAVMLHSHRKTVHSADLKKALEICTGQRLAAGNKDMRTCVGKPVKKTKTAQAGGDGDEEDEVKAKRRFKPGTAAKRAVLFQQAHSDSLAIPKANFSRFARAFAHEFAVEIGDMSEAPRWSAGAMDMLQLVCEDRLIKLCAASAACALHAKRETVNSTDFHLAQSLTDSCQ